MALLSEQRGGPPVIAWAFFRSVFIFDATVTLARRTGRGERWYSAHRNHAYQRAVLSGCSHAHVASAMLVLSAGIGVLGMLTVNRPELLPWCAGSALIVLTAACVGIELRDPMPNSDKPT